MVRPAITLKEACDERDRIAAKMRRLELALGEYEKAIDKAGFDCTGYPVQCHSTEEVLQAWEKVKELL